MKEILNYFAEQNLHPSEIIPDGRIHRFKADSDDKKNSGWYVGYQNHTVKSGEVFCVVVFGNYRTGETFIYQDDKITYSAADNKNIKEQIAKAKKQQEAIRDNLHLETAVEVKQIWDNLNSDGSSDYLVKKRISDCKKLNIKFDGKGNLYVPCSDLDGKLWSFERIGWDGTKRFHAGGRISGCMHVIGDLGETIYIAEGFSTAASISLALDAGVICAFSASNLERVVGDVRKKFPDSSIIVCGDDDKWQDSGKNPGRDSAERAAKICLGIAVFPEFKEGENKFTDFNDLHSSEGLEEVKKQIIQIKTPDKKAVYALGFKENEYFFTSTQNRQVVAVSTFAEKDFLNLMTIDYWEALFPASGSARVNWTDAKSNLMDQCRRRGIFQSRNVRGAGVWNDEGRVVVNMGDYLLVDNDRVELGNIKSRYFYTLGAKLYGLQKDFLSVDDCDVLVRACSSFKWLKQDFGFLLAGALVTSRICGSLPIRPHTWITGGAQTGKTTLLEKLIKPILGENSLYVQGNTSEAGVRQSLKADAVPVIFDEFETTGQKSSENISSIVELMRASWSDSSAMIIKGGAQGNATAYQVRFAAIVSSIRTNLTNDADKSRFAIIELAPHGSNEIQWDELSTLLNQIDVEYGNRLFARTIKMVPTLLQNFKKLKSALAKRSSQRFGDQYGMLLAGYSILIDDESITDEGAEMLADHVSLIDEKENAKVKDEDDCLLHLKTSKIEIENGRGKNDMLVYEAISMVKKREIASDHVYADRALQRLGIRVDSEYVAIVACNHAALEAKIFRHTHWSKKWGNSLSRIVGAVKKKIRINGLPCYAVLIPVSIFEIE